MTDADIEERREKLRDRLAEIGVPLFRASSAGAGRLETEEYSGLIVALLRSDDARLWLAIPCVLAAHDGRDAAAAVTQAAISLSAGEIGELGLLYRLSRCLVVSRSPLLMLLLGKRPLLPPLPIEPADVPDPSELCGEKGLGFASEWYCELGLPDLPGGAERQFDTWLDLVQPARHRESA